MKQRTRAIVMISMSIAALVLLSGFLVYWTAKDSAGSL